MLHLGMRRRWIKRGQLAARDQSVGLTFKKYHRREEVAVAVTVRAAVALFV
jgi:hypothetical protein